MSRMRHYSPFSVVALALLLCACSGASRTSGQGGPSEPSSEPAEEAQGPSVADYETFDPSAYTARPPERTVAVPHQVPARLLQGRADEGVKRTVEGFRIQVFSARDKQAAQDFREQVRQWWEQNKGNATSALGEDPPIVVQYSQPYYRVRMGAFADRDAAEEALGIIDDEYSNAFISRGMVTVTQ